MAIRCVFAVPGLAFGCAQGVEDMKGNPFGVSDSVGEASTGAADSSSTTSGSSSEDEGTSSDGDEEGPGSTSGVVSTTDPDTGSDDGSSSDDGSGPIMCQNHLTCAGAMVIGGVSGDEPSAPLNASGDEPTWLAFQVSENNNDISGEKLTFTATLTSPAGLDFDLYVFRGPAGGTSGCGGTQSQSTNAAAIDSVYMEWGEGTLANNADDDAWIAVEVRAKNGFCEPGLEWTLTVTGDT